jgi:hypothetical protein
MTLDILGIFNGVYYKRQLYVEAFRKGLENFQFISKALYTFQIINTSNYYVS